MVSFDSSVRGFGVEEYRGSRPQPEVTTYGRGDYSRDFRPITQPEPDKGPGSVLAGEGAVAEMEAKKLAAMASVDKLQAEALNLDAAATVTGGKILGNIFDLASAGIKAGDTIVERQARTDTWNRVYPLQEEYTEGLATADIGMRLRGAGTAAGLRERPAELSQFPEKLNVLEGARANGKISETGYYSRLAMAAKDLRSKYPGHREYIDRQIAEITGVHPANELVKSMIGDINAYITHQNTEKEKTLGFLRNHLKDLGPTGAELYSAFENGQIGAQQVVAHAGKILGAKGDREAELEKWKLVKEREEWHGTAIKQEALNAVDTKIVLDMQKFLLMSGDDEYTNAQRLMNINASGNFGTRLDKETGRAVPKSGPSTMVWQRNQLIARQHMNLMEQEIVAELQRPINLGGRPTTAWALMGDKPATDAVKEKLRPYASILDSIENEKYGAIHAVTRSIATSKNENYYNIRKNGKLSDLIQTVEVFKTAGGDQIWTHFSAAGLGSLVPKIGTDTVREVNMSLAVQPNIPPFKLAGGNVVGDVRKEGQRSVVYQDQPLVVNDGLEMLRQVIKDSGVVMPPRAEAALINHQVEFVPKLIRDDSGNTPDWMKARAAIGMFAPENRVMLHKFDREIIDPVSKRVIPGAYKIYTDSYNDRMVKEINKLDHIQPGLKADYVNTGMYWFRTLFEKELQDLDTVAPDNFKLLWDSDNHIFTYLESAAHMPGQSDTRVSFSPGEGELPRIKQAIARINQGLQGPTALAKDSGQDVNAYLAHMLVRAVGPKPDSERFNTKMLDAVIAGNK